MIGTIKELIIAIKGAGEMATGVARSLFESNIKSIFMMEIRKPVAVRRKVSFCEAIYDETAIVEGIMAKKILDIYEIRHAWDNSTIPVIIDPEWNSIKEIQPHVVIDAIIAKKNLGTNRSEARLVIGLGPGFEAGKDVHIAIETNRGHNLGRIILNGCPEPNTGTPGNISGFTRERVLRAPCSGLFRSSLSIGASIKKTDIVGHVNDRPVISEIDGILRGLIRDHTNVAEGLKIGDIDPRGNIKYCSTVSEKARTIGGSVLEAVLGEFNK